MRFLREREVRTKAGNIARATLYRWEKLGLFPKRRKLGPSCVAWRSDEIEKWCESRRSKEFRPVDVLPGE